MARIYFFVEGQTEQTYADTVLKYHLGARGVYLEGPILVAHCRKKGRTHRGGGRKYLPMRNDILRFTKQERSEDVFFTTMIDLYGIPSDFPGLEAAENLRNDPQARVTSLEAAWLNIYRTIRDLFLTFNCMNSKGCSLRIQPSLASLTRQALRALLG